MGTDGQLPLRIRAAALSDIGLRRTNNEDAFLLDAEHRLFAVSDGMGGHSGGEIASALAVDSLRQALAALRDQDYLCKATVANRQTILQWLAQTVDSISRTIQLRAVAEPQLHGMGCTLDAVLLRDGGLFLAHVGDSRVYLLRQGTLYQLTEDHSFGQMLLKAGVLTQEEVAQHPQRNVLTRALGPFPNVQVDTAYVEVTSGDVILLCSDGLYNEVSPSQLQHLLEGDPSQAPAALIAAAREAGARDNVTALVFKIDECTVRRVVIGSALVLAALEQSSFFAGFSASELLRVQQIAGGRELAAGELLVEAGQQVAAFFLVVSGQLSIWRNGQQVGIANPGDPAGELSLSPEPTAVSVRADTPALVLEFSHAAVGALLHSDSVLAAKLNAAALKRLAHRLRNVVDVLARHREAGLIPAFGNE